MPALKYLADTNAVCDVWRYPTVLDWFNQHRDAVALSVFTIADIRRGIALRQGTKEGASLERRLRFILEDFREAILPFDEAAAQEWGRMMAECAQELPPLGDSYIGAVARACGLVVVTRNVQHFRPVARVNPHDGSEYPPAVLTHAPG